MRSTIPVARRFMHTFLFLFVILSPVVAQTPPEPGGNDQLGTQPYQSYHGGEIDSVNLSTGTLSVKLPFLTYPQRGSVPLSFDLMYNNSPQHFYQSCDPGPPKTCEYDWGSPGGYPLPLDYGDMFVAWAQQVAVVEQPIPFKSGTHTYYYGNYFVMEADGSKHVLGNEGTVSYTLSGLSYTQTSTGPFESLDTTSWRVQGPFTTTIGTGPLPVSPTAVIGPDGIRYGSTTEDPNGNKITSTSTTITDSLGRSIPVPPTYASASNTTTAGCTGPLPIKTAVLWTPPGYQGSNMQYKFCYVTVTPNIGVNGVLVGSFTVLGTPIGSPLLQSIVLPNGQTWEFEYNDPDATQTNNGSPVTYGTLSKITLPTGGTISYTYTSEIGQVGCWNGGRWVSSRIENANDGTGAHTWTYTYSGASTYVTDPVGNDVAHNFTSATACGRYEQSTQYYQGSHTSGTLLKTVTTAYTSNTSVNTNPLTINQVPVTITTAWANGQTKQETRSYDSGFAYINFMGNTDSSNGKYGRVTQLTDSDYGSGAPGPLLKQTSTAYMAISGPNASSYLTNNMLSLPYTVQITNGSGAQMANVTYGYDGSSLGSSGVTEQHDSSPPAGTYRGNNTSISQWLNSGTLTCQNGHTAGTNSNVTSTKLFFDTGMVQTSYDSCNNSTGYGYSAAYYGAFPTTVTNALSQITTYTFDLTTGLVASVQDPNNLLTTYGYDEMWRLTSITNPDNGVDTVTFQETSFPVTDTITAQINASTSKTQTNVFDGFGRISQTQLTSDPQGTVYVDTSYDALGRVSTVSNPHRVCGSDPTSSCGITTYGYDGLSRKTSVTYPDNSVLTTAYCGPETLVTDPTNRWRRSRVDGLERLVEVDEPNAPGASVASTGCPGTGEPIWITSYTLDALGNLTNVVQNGSHARSFTFDSLSRLQCSSNPESATAACPAFGATTFPAGTLTYVYNPDGPITKKTDARSISTSYSYDALHRELSRSYSNGDPTVSTAYDQPACLGLGTCQNIGHRTSMTDAAGSEAWSYEVDKTNLRTLHANQRTTEGITNNSTYYLDLVGNAYQLVYPTGRTLTYKFSGANRPLSVVDATTGTYYATGFSSPPSGCPSGAACYTPQGTPYAFSLGQTSSFTGINVTDTYNTRLQPLEFKASSTGGNAMDISYNFVDPVSQRNAGHVYSIANNLNSSRTQSFTYDQVNRILSAGTSATTGTYCWGYQFSYDAWGNLLAQAGWTPQYNSCSQPVISGLTADGGNHLSALAYDASGNATSDGTNAYTWNGESQLKSGSGVSYAYDGDGRRVAKVGSKLYWYGSDGEILAETDGSGNLSNEYVYFAGRRIARLAWSH
ncbi:MAG: hypothetical protein WAK20_12170 [Candidatus Acidiferrum sp.]